MKWGVAFEKAMELKIALAQGCERVEIVGSVKRHDKDECHDIEILCIPDSRTPRPEFGNPKVFKNRLEKVIADMQYLELIGQAAKNGEKYKKFQILKTGEVNTFYLDLFIVRHDTWAIQNVIRTGPAEFSHRFVTNKAFGGLLPDRYKYIAGETKIQELGGNGILDLKEETDAIELLGFGWIPPMNRREYINR